MYNKPELEAFIRVGADDKLEESKINELTDYFMKRQLIVYNDTKYKFNSLRKFPMSPEELDIFAKHLFDMQIIEGITAIVALK